MKLKYLKGNLVSDSLTEAPNDWVTVWMKEALDAKENNEDLITFRVPRGQAIGFLDIGGKVEEFLQKEVFNK